MKSVRIPPFIIPERAYRADLRTLVRMALAEDIGTGDRTTAALDLRGQTNVAKLTARTSGVLAGADAFAAVYRHLDRGLRLTWKCRAGRRFDSGATIVTVHGRAAAILTGERTAINFLAHLSGVATKAREMVERIPQGTARLLDTRKTTPGWRLLEKRAAVFGGAANHRLGLHDALMIKDNHIAACGDIETAIRRAQVKQRDRPLICEVRTMRELRLVLNLGIDWVLLDNFTPARLRTERAQAAHLSSLPAVVRTRAPKALASWIAVVPMPLEPPWTRRLSPGLRPARSKTLLHTVKKVSGSAAASVRLRPLGAGRHWAAGAAQYSA